MNHPLSRISDFLPFTWVDGPGNRIVFFLQGCNFDCKACHNPQTIPLESVQAHTWSVADVLVRIRESMPYITGVTVSGGEATLQHEFLLALFSRIKSDPEFNTLSTFIDSNGFVEQSVWDSLLPVTDGVMLDLKMLDNAGHIELTGQSNALVLDSIRYLAGLGKLYETRLMLAPGINDSDEQLHQTGRWLMGIDPEMRIKINHFHAHGTRNPAREWQEADDERKDKNRNALEAAGVRNLC